MKEELEEEEEDAEECFLPTHFIICFLGKVIILLLIWLRFLLQFVEDRNKIERKKTQSGR